MAIADAGKLGEAISQHEGNLEAALEEYQQERMAQTAKEVCPHVRHPVVVCSRSSPVPFVAVFHIAKEVCPMPDTPA